MKFKKQLFVVMFVLCFILALPSYTEAAWKNCGGGNRRYYISSAKYVKSQWYRIQKKWYYFDEKGYEKRGRFQVDGSWYYSTKKTGRVKNKLVGKYYYGADGVMITNTWKKIKGHYFYFGEDGCIKYGRFTVDGETYYCKKKTGRVQSKRVGSYYYDKQGRMVRNRWIKNFYYGSDGKLKTGKFTAADGNTYYVDKKKGKLTSQWKNKNYYDSKGIMATSCWINGSYVDETGTITKGNKNPKNPPSASDIRWLAAITYLEAGNQSYYGKKCVASVVVNRVNSKRFPNTIKSVLFQSGQFTPAANGTLSSLYYSKKKIQTQCVKAATYVLEHGSILKGYYYFNNSGTGLKIGDHYFN